MCSFVAAALAALPATTALGQSRDYGAGRAARPLSGPATSSSSTKRFKPNTSLGNTPIQASTQGYRLWAEGPAWNGLGRFLVWSDIPNNVVHRRALEEDGHVSAFRSPSNNANGNTFDWRSKAARGTSWTWRRRSIGKASRTR